MYWCWRWCWTNSGKYDGHGWPDSGRPGTVAAPWQSPLVPCWWWPTWRGTRPTVSCWATHWPWIGHQLLSLVGLLVVGGLPELPPSALLNPLHPHNSTLLFFFASCTKVILRHELWRWNIVLCWHSSFSEHVLWHLCTWRPHQTFVSSPFTVYN